MSSFLLNAYRFGGGAGAGGSPTDNDPLGSPTDLTDPQYANIELLLHFNGADGDNTTGDIIDSGPNGRTPSSLGSGIELDNAQVKWGATSCLFPGTARIDYASAAWQQPGADDFTFEAWIRHNGSAGDECWVSKYTSVSDQRCFIFDHNTTFGSGIRFVWSLNGSSTSSLTGSWSPTADTWHHVAACRDGTNLRLFADGTQIGSTGTITGTLKSAATPFQLGAYQDTNSIFDGWMDDFRFTRYARYTSNFTAPTAQFPDSG